MRPAASRQSDSGGIEYIVEAAGPRYETCPTCRSGWRRRWFRRGGRRPAAELLPQKFFHYANNFRAQPDTYTVRVTSSCPSSSGTVRLTSPRRRLKAPL